MRIEFAGAMYHVVAWEDRREEIVKDRLFAKGSRKVAASNRVAGKPKKDRNNVKKPCLTPYPLKHSLAGFWSRRITDEHRMVYRVGGETLEIAQLRYHYAK
jgi:Txe/YoeB family toxin of toxin-antitoxin system